MIPVMALHEVHGYWESEPGNDTTLFLNVEYISYITPYGEDKFRIAISGEDEAFVCGKDSVSVGSPAEAFQQHLAEQAWGKPEKGDN